MIKGIAIVAFGIAFASVSANAQTFLPCFPSDPAQEQACELEKMKADIEAQNTKIMQIEAEQFAAGLAAAREQR